MKALVIGFTTEKGYKISDFLVRKGVLVSVADNRLGQPVREIEGISRIFTLNPKHRDSMWLMFEVSKPDVLVYCSSGGDYSMFLNTLLISLKNKISKIVLVATDKIKDSPETIFEVETNAMVHALCVLSKTGNYESLVIYPEDNLLKEVKKFLLKEEQEGEIL